MPEQHKVIAFDQKILRKQTNKNNSIQINKFSKKRKGKLLFYKEYTNLQAQQIYLKMFSLRHIRFYCYWQHSRYLKIEYDIFQLLLYSNLLKKQKETFCMSSSLFQLSKSRRHHIKKFQSRVLNRSCADFLFYDKLADYLLQCCSAQAKPNTLSIYSLLPLIFCSIIVTPQQSYAYIVTIISLLMHQIFDIANKKQAYRLSEFNLGTYYIDHLYDSISCILIVNVMGKLFELENSMIFWCIFFFAMLPFFTHHLAMYTSGYLTFWNVTPAVEGILAIEIFLLACVFFPGLPTFIIFDFKVCHIILIFSTIWLMIFLIDDFRTIARLKKQHQSLTSHFDNIPLKNLFIIGVIGYIMIELTMIQEMLLKNNLYFFLALSTFTLMFTFIISELILSYALEQKHRQFTLNVLGSLMAIVLFYTICVFVDMEYHNLELMGELLFGFLFVGQLAYFLYYHFTNIKLLNMVIQDQ